MRRWRLAALAGALAVACDAGGPSGPMAGAHGGDAVARARVLGRFLARHWALPVPPQGLPPASYTEAEASLGPETCGSCHPQQLAEWSTSLHAAAFSPGFAGQLLEGALSDPDAVRGCQTCHAPLAEQQPTAPGGAPNPHFRPELRERGLLCAGCHVRAHRHFGPPRRPDAPAAPEPVPHGGFEARAEFRESRFCAPCHQFFDEGVNGKPVQNTWAEWRESPHAAEGRTCQSCHMPDRAHLWRGIHDPEMVRDAVDVTLVPAIDDGNGRVRATLVLTSRGVGHHFPTYVTPRVLLRIWQADAAGGEIEATRRQAVIGREIDFSSWTEVRDTRVPAGGAFELAYDEARAADAVRLVARVVVEPDHHYAGVFASLRDAAARPDARALLAEALRRAEASRYVLAETRHRLP